MKCSIEKNELVIRIPLIEPRPSGSGKNLVVATSGGNQDSGVIHPKLGSPIKVGINAYCKAEVEAAK